MMTIHTHIFTNCTASAPSTEMLRRTYNSFYTAFGHMPLTIWIDPNPNPGKYERYHHNLANKFGAENLRKSSSLSDGYIRAITESSAEYLLMLEHDWIIDRTRLMHTLPEILAAMRGHGIDHLRFNKRGNTPESWDREMSEHGDAGFRYCRTNNVSNNPHILRRAAGLEWIDKRWIEVKPGSDGIEQKHLRNPRTWGAIYGGLGYPQVIHHLDGSGKWAGRDEGELRDQELTSIVIPSLLTHDENRALEDNIRAQATGNIEIVSTCRQLSAAQNRNLALEMATGDYVIMLDDDIRDLPHGFDQTMVDALKQHPEWGIVAARLLNADGTIQHTSTDNADTKSEYIIDEIVPGACMAFRRSDIRFDEHFIAWGYEDTDYCHRMPGAKVVLNRLRVTHLNQEKGRNVADWKRNTEHFNAKWGVKKKR